MTSKDHIFYLVDTLRGNIDCLPDSDLKPILRSYIGQLNESLKETPKQYIVEIARALLAFMIGFMIPLFINKF